MNFALQHQVGKLVKLVAAIRPQSAGSDVNGISIDRLDYNSGVVHLAVGAATGSPTAQTVSVKLQHSDDESTWEDTGIVSDDLTADDTELELDVDFVPLKRYVRVVVQVSFTGGTSPTIPVACTLALGGGIKTPA